MPIQTPSIFEEQDLVVGDRAWTTIQLYDPRDGTPFTDLEPALTLRDPAGDLTIVGVMVETTEPGTYESNYIVDDNGEWVSIVTVPPPREATFEKTFYVNAPVVA